MPTPTMPPTPVLRTPRLILRPLRAKDAPTIHRRFAKWEVVRHLSAQVPWPYPPDGSATHIAQCLEQMARGEKSFWAITLKAKPDELIGRIDLWPDDGVSQDMRGFWLDPEFQRQGLMTEAAERVTEYAFRVLKWPRLWLSNAQGNIASRRIKEKQGAQLFDLQIGHYVGGEDSRMVWLLSRDAWLARHPAAVAAAK